MKKYALISIGLVLASPSAWAWPFVSRNTNAADQSGEPRGLSAQLDADRAIEIFTGGNHVLNFTSGDFTPLPLPSFDYDPYQPVDPVTFVDGRGAIGDIDGDGDADIVRSALVAYNGSAEGNYRIMACLRSGNGVWNGGWQFKQTVLSNAQGFRAPGLKLADLDRDGDLDLVDTFAAVRIHWNPGNGDFSGAPQGLYSGSPELEIADFDGNGWPDIAVLDNVPGLNGVGSGNSLGRFTLLANNGGTFTGSTIATFPAASLSVYHATDQADLDGDGRMDVLATQSSPAGGYLLVWYRNTGSGFAPAASLLSLLYGQAQGVPSFATGDVDEDGRLDIVFSTRSGEAQLLHGSGNGSFAAPAVLHASSSTNSPRSLCIADVDGDGDSDIVLDAGLSVLENTAIHKRSDATVTTYAGTLPSGSVDLTVGDLNNDGKDDLIAADGGGKRLLWYAGTGGGLSAAALVSTGSLAPAGVAAGDFNRDGWTDLVWTTPNTLNQALSSNGSGLGWQMSAIAGMTGITRILAEDEDLDGDLDVLSISPAQGVQRWHRNNGSASLWLPENVSTGLVGLSAMCTGQEVPGGRPEIASLIAGGSGGSYRRHSYVPGDGWISSVEASTAGGGSSNAVIMADVVSATPGLETIYALNDSAIWIWQHGQFQPMPVSPVSHTVSQLAAVDWNGDGFADILAATSAGVKLFVNQRTTNWTVTPAVYLSNGAPIQDIAILDLNGDGMPDAAAVTETGAILLIYNRSGAVDLSISSEAVLPLLPGETGTPISVSGTNKGYIAASGTTGDASAAPAQLALRFLRSSVAGGVDTPGSPLTLAEVTALVDSISLRRQGSSLVSAAPDAVANGIYRMTVSAPVRTLLSAAPGQQADFQVAVKLKSTAASSAVSRFYVEYSPASPWVALDAAAAYASGPGTLPLSGESELKRTLLIVDSPTPLEQWRMTNFNTYFAAGISANSADPDKDGVCNLLEYVMNRNPNSNTGILETTSVIGLTTQGLNTPLIADLRLLGTFDSRVRISLEETTNLTAWNVRATRTGATGWVGDVLQTAPLQGGRNKYTFNTGAIPSVQPKYYLRVKIEEQP